MNPTEIILALIYATIIANNLVLRSQRNEARQTSDLLRTEVADQTKRAEEAEVRAMEADERVERSDRRVGELVTAVAPLIEKTDWMTGRWHGQMSALVAMEAARNDKVVIARKALWDIPLVQENAKSFDGWTKLPAHLAVKSTNITAAVPTPEA